uniref:Uncharacterized protein n=1 Tax=Oryza nivara TaxID=4536 RepID=A0A0E0GWE4_ORYNI
MARARARASSSSSSSFLLLQRTNATDKNAQFVVTFNLVLKLWREEGRNSMAMEIPRRYPRGGSDGKVIFSGNGARVVCVGVCWLCTLSWCKGREYPQND